eukprot:m.123163 g.123163  ORF g.123163 m.123163 type:complete len:559 (-) comp9402_c0_seq1:2745-4421(-)
MKILMSDSISNVGDGRSTSTSGVSSLVMRMVVFITLFLHLGCAGELPKLNSKPNVLVFFADDLGYGDTGFTGHPTIRTPNIDKLAREGMVFTQWYSGFHVCSPSRASMMTGRLPIRVGVIGRLWTGGVFGNVAVGGLPLNETTFPELMKRGNYSTGMFGKWHLGQREQFLPSRRGFDEYLGIPYSVDMGSSAWHQTNDVPLPLLRNTDVIEQPVNLNTLSSQYAKFADEFIQNSTSSGTPFFLYASFSHVHVPDFADRAFCNSSLRGRYGDAVSEMDNLLGSVYQSVVKAGVEDNTITFFSSDNGPWKIQNVNGGSSGLFHGAKETTWEGGVREPGFVHWPGKIEAGVNTEVVTTYDILPTVTKLAGIPLPKDRVYDGKDLSGVIFAKQATPHDCIFIYKGAPGLACPSDHPDCPGLWAVRCGAYKMHFVTAEYSSPFNGVFHDPPLLYQIENDPSEAYPLPSNSSEYQTQHEIIHLAVEEHKSTLTPVPNQIAMGGNIDFAVCGCPNSKILFPNYPNCTCSPLYFELWHCTSDVVHVDFDLSHASNEFTDTKFFPSA